MKKAVSNHIFIVMLLTMSIAFLNACSNDEDDSINTISQSLTEADKNALLFMLEEEKLARDTYYYLDNLWEINQFSNIKLSEQTHMNLVSNLLDIYDVEYSILPYGEFVNQDIQTLYNQFETDGQINQANALQIGATIEDLDIVDLQNHLNTTTNATIVEVFENLQCGSRNHLRSFINAIENQGNTYTPQYLSQEEFDVIIASNHEQCN